jgi:secondary thiamine-phosphate synthase enzyme
MAPQPRIAQPESPEFRAYTDRILVRTRGVFRFIDLTEAVQQRVRRSGIVRGQVTVQTRHTTTAIVVNENEPLLIEDLKELIREWAPRDRPYRHDDMARRREVPPDERINGHSHARAILLGTSANLVIDDARMELGPWQSIFLVELDGAQRRTVSVCVVGECAGTPDRMRAGVSAVPLALADGA